MSFHRATALVGACAALAVPFVACSETHFDTLCDLHPEQCCDLDPTLPGCGDVGAETSSEGGADADTATDAPGDAPTDADAETEVGPVCTKGDIRCSGADLEQCATDGMSWLKLATCPSVETCDAKAGRCTACTPDAYRCDGSKRLQCDKLGKTEAEVATCDTLELCLASTGATCAKAACAVGEKKCEGAKALVCNAGRTAFDSTPCASAALCTAGSCTPPACATGDKRCSGKKVQTCKADLTGWDDTETCAIDCDGGTAPACLKVTQLSSGGYHTCALLSNGSLRCWGRNDGWESLGAAGSAVKPTVVTGIGKVTRIATSGYVTAAAMTDNSVWAWGQPPGKSGSQPPTKLAIGSAVPKQLAISTNHFCLRDSDTIVKCMGGNALGQLGDGTTTDRSTLTDVPPTTGLDRPVVVGVNATISLDATNPHGWGYNLSGVLGDGSGGNQTAPIDVYPGASDICLDRNGEFSCAVVAGGVKCSGYAFFVLEPKTLWPVSIAGFTSATKVSCSDRRACVVDGGGVKCWGAGRLGNGSTSTSTTPVSAIPAGSGVVDIVVGGYHSCALFGDKTTVKCWGDYGETGIGSVTVDTTVPVAITW